MSPTNCKYPVLHLGQRSAVSVCLVIARVGSFILGHAGLLWRYVRDNFYSPLSTKLASAGFKMDVDTANIKGIQWLNDVANVRIMIRQKNSL